MCIIVDANVAARLCTNPLPPDAEAVVRWIDDRGGVVVHGGRLTEELIANNHVRRLLLTLARAGRARQLASGEVDAEADRIANLGVCVSDDPHVIAVAKISG